MLPIDFYLITLFAASFISVALAIYAWHSKLPFRYSFIILMAAIACWATGYAFELGSNGIDAKMFWIKIQYFGIVAVPPAWFMLVLQYAGRERWITKMVIAILSIDPIVTIALAWTNEWHKLIWKSAAIIEKGGLSLINFEYGIWAYLRSGYAYILILFTVAILLHIFLNSYRIYRRQAAVLLLFSLIPLAGNALYVFKISLVDLTPFGFLAGGVLLLWSFSKFRLLDIKPLAMATLIENMQDGIVALDRNCRIVEINPAACRIMGVDEEVVGRHVDELKKFHVDLPKMCGVEKETVKEIEVERGGDTLYYEIKISPLKDRYGNLLGYLFVIHDITQRKEALKKMEEALEKEREFKLKTAHYFFNPLCIAKGYLELLKRDCKKEEIDRIIKAIDRVENVVKNIVIKGKIEE